jgi:hypothetical protein
MEVAPRGSSDNNFSIDDRIQHTRCGFSLYGAAGYGTRFGRPAAAALDLSIQHSPRPPEPLARTHRERFETIQTSSRRLSSLASVYPSLT